MENLGFLARYLANILSRNPRHPRSWQEIQDDQDLGNTSKMSKIFQDLGKANKSASTGL